MPKGPHHRLQTGNQGVRRMIRGRRHRAPTLNSKRKQRVLRNTQMQRSTKGNNRVVSSIGNPRSESRCTVRKGGTRFAE
eukprot:7788411-Pyramimonas_sp.AAC.1